MKITTLRINSFILAVGFLFLSANLIGQDIFEDNFNTAHDYVADSIAGTMWDGYMINSGVDGDQNAELFAMNTNDVPGSLYLEASGTNWDWGGDDGAFLYKVIDADKNFDIQVMIGPNSNFASFDGVIYYNAAGLQVKFPVADSMDFINLLAFDMPGWNAVHLVKVVDGGDGWEKATAVAESIGTNPWLRIKRDGFTFTTYYGPDGIEWHEINSVDRTDMIGTPLLVGICQANFSNDTAYVEYDSLKITTTPMSESETYEGFDVGHDYLADSTTGTFWDGYMLNSGVDGDQNAELFAMNTNDVSGSLYIEATETNWDWGGDDGPFLYKTVGADEDFDISVMIGPHSNFSSLAGVIYYNAAGLQVKHPEADSMDFINLLAFDMPHWNAVHLVKVVDGGNGWEKATAVADSILGNPWLRIKRSGPKFTTYYGPDGMEWSEINTVIREDLMGTELLVGICQANFSNDTAFVAFDHFHITTSPMDISKDDFATGHDYLADSTTGTFWDGYMLNSGVDGDQNAELFAMNTNDIPGSLYIEASRTNWDWGGDDGVHLYKEIDSDMDFTMSVKIGPNSNFSSLDGVIYYNAAGLQVKHPVADSMDFINLLAFDMPHWNAVHLVKIVDGGDGYERATAEADSIEANPWLRITKTGSVFSTYYGPDGMNWTMINAVNREDMVKGNDKLLVGICQANFSDDTAYVEYDDFSLLTFDPDNTPPTVPGTPAASNITSTTLDLSFGSSSDNTAILNYDVLQDGVVISTQDTLDLAVTGLTVNTEYTFTVVARDASGNISGASEALVVSTVDTDAPTAPVNLAGSNISITGVDLTWDASTDNVAVTGYVVYQDGDSIDMVPDPGYSVSGLSAETNYEFYVTAIDAAGNESDTSNNVDILTLPTGINDIESNAFTLYPNPATDRVMIEMNTRERAEIDIFNAQGKVVFSGYFRDRMTVYKDQLGSNGFYVVRVTTSDSISTRSLIFR
jgi:chitodextrinase